MKAQHTPSKWEGEIIGMGQDEHVCNIVAGSKQIAEGVFFSDARLIAAAPQLLEALEELQAAVYQHRVTGKLDYSRTAKAEEVARAAIRAAKGE